MARRKSKRLTEDQRSIVIYRYANFDLSAKEFNECLSLGTYTLVEILRHPDGRELLDSLVMDFNPTEFWP